MSNEAIIMCCCTAGMFVTSILTTIFMNRKVKNEVSFSPESPSKEEFCEFKKENKSDHEGMHTKMGGIQRGVDARLDAAVRAMDEKTDRLVDEGNQSRTELRRSIEILIQATAELKGRVDENTKCRNS